MNQFVRNLAELLFLSTALTAAAGLAERNSTFAADKAAPPAAGDVARDFTLSTADGESVILSKLTKTGPVVLIVLRGNPGYQCPVCNIQVGQFLANAKKFQAAKTNIVLVYPGPADGLKEHAAEFIRGKTLPENVYLTLDPDFDFTTSYGLRWNAKNETAYPSTFVVDKAGKVKFARISMTHGDRATADEVLKALASR